MVWRPWNVRQLLPGFLLPLMSARCTLLRILTWLIRALKKLLRDEVASSGEQTDLEKHHPSSGSVCSQRKVGSSNDLSVMKSTESASRIVHDLLLNDSLKPRRWKTNVYRQKHPSRVRNSEADRGRLCLLNSSASASASGVQQRLCVHHQRTASDVRSFTRRRALLATACMSDLLPYAELGLVPEVYSTGHIL